jgi:hypothetical protein
MNVLSSIFVVFVFVTFISIFAFVIIVFYLLDSFTGL